MPMNSFVVLVKVYAFVHNRDFQETGNPARKIAPSPNEILEFNHYWRENCSILPSTVKQGT